MLLLSSVLASSVMATSAKTDNPVIKAPLGVNDNNNKATCIVTGTLVDSEGLPIIGGTINVSGTRKTAVTDINGKFSIEAPKGSDLEISYLGYSKEHMHVNNDKNVKISMKEEAHALQEVVAIGYGSTTVKSSTGSITSVKADDLTKTKSSQATTSPVWDITSVSSMATNWMASSRRKKNSTVTPT